MIISLKTIFSNLQFLRNYSKLTLSAARSAAISILRFHQTPLLQLLAIHHKLPPILKRLTTVVALSMTLSITNSAIHIFREDIHLARLTISLRDTLCHLVLAVVLIQKSSFEGAVIVGVSRLHIVPLLHLLPHSPRAAYQPHQTTSMLCPRTMTTPAFKQLAHLFSVE